MIANSASGHSNFGGAIGYALKEQKCEQWEAHNLSGIGAAGIAEEMRWEVQNYNKDRSEYHSVSTPVYHVSISWAEADSPTIEEKMQVGRAFLNHIGLDDHQAIIASHNDKPYDHIHVVANRVNPKTQQLWNPYIYDGKGANRHIIKGEYQQHEEVMRAAEARFGWEPVQGVHVGNPTRNFDRTRALTQGEYHFRERAEQAAEALGMPEADTRPIKTRAGELTDELYKANSFKELDQVLAQNGLYIESKGQGAVISDGAYSVKASSISRGLSGPKLEDKFGEKLANYENRRESTIDPEEGNQRVAAFVIAHQEKVADAVAHQSSFKADAHQGQITTIKQFNEQITPARQQLREAVATAFNNPGKAMERLGARASEVGMGQARSELLQHPDRFGTVANRRGTKQAARSMEKAQNVLKNYSNQLTNKTGMERNKLIKNHQAHKKAWNKLKGQAQQMASSAMRKSRGGEAAAGSAGTLISTNRAIHQIAMHPKKGAFHSTQELLAKAQARMQGDSGAAVGSIMKGVQRNGKTIRTILTNPTRGSFRLIKQALSGGQRAAGRASPGMERSL